MASMDSGFPSRSSFSVKYSQLFIDGEFVDSVTGKTFETIDPSTGEVIATIAEASSEDVDLAVKAARKAFDQGPWPRLPGHERARILHKFADLVEQNQDELAALETLDNGKPIVLAKHVEAGNALKTLRYYAGSADKIHGQTCKMDGPFLGYTLKEPIGVVGQITPWNFPTIMFFGKVAPALACGCTVVIKPAEQTPLTALYCAHLSKQAGFPPGVLNVLTGYGSITGAAIANHMNIDKVAFTGSTEVGCKIMEASGKSNLKPMNLELGGKSPLIVMNDADVNEAVEIACMANYFNMGQVCMAATRVFVHEDIYDEFVRKAEDKAKSLPIGDPFDPTVQHGPQIDREQYDKILRYIEHGKSEGANLVTGGKPWGTKGFYIEPTIFSDVEDDMKIAQDEIFGPVMSILKFKSVEEAIERGNRSIYGLCAGVITKDMNVANTVATSLKAGVVWINCYLSMNSDCPLGGYKMSGIGREFGSYGLDNYLQVKSVITPLHNPAWL